MTRIISALVAAVFAGLAGFQQPPRPVSLVLVSIDGLRPDYVLEADRYGLKIPNLRQLLRDGVRNQCLQGCFERFDTNRCRNR